MLDKIAELLPGKMYDNYYAAICPFHDDNKPSLMVYDDMYRCLACGALGKTETLIRKLRGKPKADIPYRHSNFPWRKWLSDGLDALVEKAHSNLTNFPDLACFLRKRGIEKAIKPLKLGYIDGVYIFPVYMPDGSLGGVVGRAGEVLQNETGIRYSTPPNQSGMLFSPDWKLIEKSNFIMIPFGIIDAIVLWLIGFPAMTWTIGKHIPADAFSAFRKPIIIVPDHNEMRDANMLAADLGWRAHILKIDFPEKTKDIADIWQIDRNKTIEILEGSNHVYAK